MPDSFGGVMGKAEIVNFAVHILGCGCDKSVFDSIEKEENIILNCGIRLRKKIVIGKRLLIYIADADKLRPEDIMNVIKEGVSERNRMGYNRLRLAIITPDANGISSSYLSEFGILMEKDDKTNIHIVSEDNAI